MENSSSSPLRYAGFWPRLASLILDFIITLPLLALVGWGISAYRLFELYYFVPGTLFWFFYSVYLVKRFGGTPGKLIVGIRICKLNGEPAGYREAFLRYFPDFILWTLAAIAMLVALFHMTDAEYHSLSPLARGQRLLELESSWRRPLQWIQNSWTLSEFVVLLTNRKRRALHDFIAGTVVVFKPRTANLAPRPNAIAPATFQP